MKTSQYSQSSRSRLLLVILTSALMVACSAAMVRPTGPTAARSKLTALQADPKLASRAPVAMKDAEQAVASAERPQSDAELATHLNYLADRKVDTARALAETQYAEDQRLALRQQRDSVRLAARTREADAAVSKAAAATAEGASQKLAADAARGDADQAHRDADQARGDTAELQRQIDTLQAKATDRGLVLTLGDVLFATGQANLRSAANGNLDRLVAFLGKYPDRSVSIEGHTDSVGSAQYNQDLSLRRANAVSSYLRGQGIAAARISTVGKGESDPVAGNDSADGRQQNRRVEVIIENLAVAQR